MSLAQGRGLALPIGKHKIICANFYAVYFMQNRCESAQNILFPRSI
ncbi:hypothetical protein ETAE_2839 [Edwardsiella piscicida]|uniref:Uncharacterized protein n=1 Tax=Edwardsiella piscicida TaxID=1263550 RepID=A0AAU8P5W6_EDWPI|nr:hypothetical protein ETAE_2839 [Edwardsiella tarda EIB202]